VSAATTRTYVWSLFTELVSVVSCPLMLPIALRLVEIVWRVLVIPETPVEIVLTAL